ncbi:MAG: hypothetical protein JW994_01465 [Candidatus Omnitrophica bacterium]|nr:hypothetical protein [Candidatus Omnitrophota bacterium]
MEKVRRIVLNVSVAALVIIYISLFANKVVKTDGYYGDSLRHMIRVNILAGSLKKTLTSGNVSFENVVRLVTSPIGPVGKKPLFIGLASYVNLIFRQFGISYPMAPLCAINLFSILAIGILMYFILKANFSRFAGLVSVTMLFTNFDIFYNALYGYHTVFGFALIFWAFFIDFGKNAGKVISDFFIGLLYSLSLVASTHCMPALIVLFPIKVLDILLDKRPWPRLRRIIFFALGSALPFAYILLVDFLRRLVNFKYVSFFAEFTKQGEGALYWGGGIPLQPFYFFKFYFRAESVLFAAFLALSFMLVPFFYFGMSGRKRLITLSLWTIGASTYAIFTFGHFPAIAKIFQPISIVGCGLIGIVFFMLYESALPKFKRLVVLAIFAVLCSQAINFAHKYDIWIRHRFNTDWKDANFKGFFVVKSDQIDLKKLRELYDTCKGRNVNTSKILIQLSSSFKFGHHTFSGNCFLEEYIAYLMLSGLKPYAVTKREFIVNDVYQNEYFNYFLVQNSDYGHFKDYAFMQNFPWDKIYSFRLSDIVEYDKRLKKPLLN